MVNFYKFRVIEGKKKWIEVPKLWNSKVQDALIAEGYTLNDDGTVNK